MNNIYKVIWSKAKNCYVVASEIARSHTKSATGSEKIGGVTKRSLLASLMAISLLCGGLGVASAVDGTVDVEDIEATTTSKQVYTADKVDNLLKEYGKKEDVQINKDDITTLRTETTDQGQKITANATNIARNTADIEKKIDTVTAEAKLALKANAIDVYTKADVNTELAKKADKTYVDTEVGKKANKATTLAGYDIGDAYTKAEVDTAVANAVTTAGNNVNAKLADYAKTADVNNALKGKADKATTLAGYGITDAYTKSDVAKRLNEKADKTDLTKAQTAIDGLNAKTTKITYDASNGTSVDGVTFNAGAVTGVTSINGTKIGTQEGGTYIHQDNSIWGNMKNVDTQVTTNADNIKKNKDDIAALDTKVGTVNTGTYLDSTKSVGDNLNKLNDGLAQEVADRKAADTALSGRIDANANTIAKVNQELVNTNNHFNTELRKTNAALQAEGQARANADAALANDITATNKRTGGITRNDAANETTIEGNVTVDNLGNVTAKGQLTGKGVDAGAGAITTTGAVNAGSLNVTDASNLKGDVTMDKTLSVTGDTKLKKTDVDGTLNVTGESSLKNTKVDGTLTTTGKATFKEAVEMDKGLTVTSGDTTLQNTDVKGALNVTGESSLKNTTVGGTLGVTGATTLSGELTAEKNATFEKDVTVKGTTNLKDTTVDGDLKVTGTITTDKMIFGDKATNNYTEIDHGKVISKNLVVNGAGETISSSSTFNAKENKVGFANSATGEQSSHKQTSDMIVDNVKNNITGDQSFHKQTSDVIMDNVKDLHNSNNRTQTKTETKDIITDKDGNSSTTSQTASENKTYLKDKDGKNTNSTIDTAKGYDKTIKGENGETSTKQDELNITNTAQNGTITNDAQNIVNNASGNITNKANTMDTNVTGKATESYGSLDTTVNGNETHIVKGTKTETVDGKVTENYKDGQATNVTGNQDIHVTGKQTNTVEGGQENIISGGQINNITGDQTTTITGNKNETVTENVTEDYKKNLTTTVGGNEIHDVKGTKTETVEGKLTENFKGGQETNVTGDQTTNVSGTQTTTATDINRNASSSMVDKVDNAYGTNTETKEAGKTTTDVSIKGTGEKGQYIRGANESRDYLIKGTLKNSETKTVDATSTEITDGTNKASTIQKVTDLAGSVTNGKETGVSGIHANDDGSVSIDSAVAGGGMSSVINQKKDSIQSAVGDGTNSTVIRQDKDNVTIASSNGTVAIVGKDIVNNAQDTITNTAGTSITNQVNDSKVTTDANGTTFENNTPAVSDGGATTTKINGNQITTGRVDANELGVSDKDGTNTADLSVKAGEGVKASASDGTTTGSLDVTADEVGSTVKDASGKGSTFKQRIDAIMMESKNVSIKAEETLTNEAKVITNKASEVINNEAININNTATGIIKSKASEIQNQADRLISNKVGENTWENMEDGKITTSIKNGTKQNLTQSDAAGTTQSTVDGGKSTVTIQNADGLADAVTDGRNTSVQNQTASAIAADVKDGAGNENASVATATTSANTIKSGSKANTVISTADGTSFINSEAAAPVGDGTEVKTTIKGNTITTGKVTMDYAEVMKDLGVGGNAKIDGKTTTGSLEVTGTSTLKGDVTMESNATVKGTFNVEGNTNLKNTKVDGTLDVTQKATFGDSVSIAKDLSVGGDVTANSYKVGGKTYISAAGINANDQKITNVADGSISEGSKDAVNGGQLYTVKNDLEGKVNKVGANAAAMANLRPMEFDPSSKWNIAAAIGNYGSETAAALGAFYRPNDDVMVNLSTAFGTGENMVGGGVSVRLGKGGNKLSREENNALKDQVNDLTARMDALLSVLNPNMSKDFPDVPENHWAYEAVSRLAGNDIVQGYPDGEFHGERTMTRYEMAEIIYNALSRGAEAERELVEEFKPELQAMAASEKATAERAEG